MTTWEELIYSTTQHPVVLVSINGVLFSSSQFPHTILSVRGQESYDSPVPTVDIELSSLPDWVQRGQPVLINAGFDPWLQRMFTGGVLARGDEDPDFLRTQCFVTGATDAAGEQISATASLIGGPPVWPPIPSGSYIDFSVDNHLIHDEDKATEVAGRELTRRARIPQRPSGPLIGRTIRCVGDLYGAFRSYQIPARDYSGMTVAEAIAAVLDASGVSEYDLTGVPAYTLASEGATLDRMPGSQQLAKLMAIDGCAVQQLRSGVVVVKVVDFEPAPTANFTYSTTDQDCARIIDATGELQVPFNPLLQIGQTIQLDIEHLGVSGRYFLYGHRWEIGPSGAWSYLDLRGGPDYGGTVGINPVADFTYAIEQEVIGDKVYECVTFDASTSHDPDGSIADPAGYVWTDNQTPNLVSGTGKIKTVAIDPSGVSGDWIVTLTVTDDDGLTGSVSATIPILPSSNVVGLPAIYVAMGNQQSATPDGGVNWYDQAGTDVISVGARPADGINFGHACFGRSDGSIWRTLDGCQTAPTQVASGLGSAVVEILWDWRDPTNVWALTENCRVYRSVDAGATFALYADLRTLTYVVGTATPAALGNKLGCPAAGGLYVFGGDGAGRPLIAYDAALTGQWVHQAFTGDLATDLPATSNIRIADVTAPGDGHTTIILTNATGGGASLVAIYDTTSEPGPTAAYTRATGLTPGLTDGHVIMNDAPLLGTLRYAIFNDQDVWVSSDCVAYTQRVGVLPTGVTANHGLFMSDVLTGLPGFAGIFLLACQKADNTVGIYKSVDGLQTVGVLRPATGFPAWPAGAQAKKLALGALQTGSVGEAHVLITAGLTDPDRFAAWRTGRGSWTKHIFDNLFSANTDLLLSHALTSQLWFLLGFDDAYSFNDSDNRVYRTKDGGLNWADFGQPKAGNDYWQDFALDAAGALWGLTLDVTNNPYGTAKVWRSDDDGDTWSLAATLTGISSVQRRFMYKIICHPTNQQIVAVLGATQLGGNIGTWYSTDRGLNWSLKHSPSGYHYVDAHQSGAMMLASGRILFVGVPSSGGDKAYILTSDDYGASWTTRRTFSPRTYHDVLGPVGTIVGTRVYMADCEYIGGTGAWETHVLQSLDEGTTWEQFTSDVPKDNADICGIGGIAYDAAADALYVFNGRRAGGAMTTSLLYKMSPVSLDGDWIDISSSLLPVDGEADYHIVEAGQHIMAIPR